MRGWSRRGGGEGLDRKSRLGHGKFPDGETCLHVAGIHGEVGVTKVLLEKGVNPNLISHMIEEEQDEPIEMHALSWHVFSGRTYHETRNTTRQAYFIPRSYTGHCNLRLCIFVGHSPWRAVFLPPTYVRPFFLCGDNAMEFFV